MPPATGKSRRVERCVYKEGGQRCRRSGTGNPPLCNPHMIVFVEAAKAGVRPASPIGNGVAEFLDRILNGKKINRKVINDALDDVVAAAKARTQAGPMNGSSYPFPSWPGARPPPPPPVDPRIAEKKRAITRARTALGFTPTEPVTAAEVKKRQRELAKAHHPDRPGGSTTKMQEINRAVDVLLDGLVP